MQQVELLVRLLKKGNPASLTQIRQELGKTRQEVASQIGVLAKQIEQWEEEQEIPSKKHYAQWKIKLSNYIDEVIAGLLGTEDKEINTRFWDVMWRLID
jgi:transcriptional regulator with XRE-family HTH domain